MTSKYYKAKCPECSSIFVVLLEIRERYIIDSDGNIHNVSCRKCYERVFGSCFYKRYDTVEEYMLELMLE